MQYSVIPRTGEKVTRLGFGAMGLGNAFGNYSREERIQSVLHGLSRGINLIDTARGYRESEEIIGAALKLWTGEKPFIATKVRSRGPGAAWGMPHPIDICYPKGAVTEDIETSLRMLNVDTIDLIQMHQYWPGWEKSDDWMEELLRCKEQGKVRLIGISIPDHRHDIALHLVQSGSIDSVQTILNIFDPLSLDALLPICVENKVAFIARCVLDEGGLSGFLTEATTFEETDFRKTFFEQVPKSTYIARVNLLRAFLDEDTHSLAELAIKFVLAYEGVTTALVSMHIPAYADQNIQALSTRPLSAAIAHEIRTKHRWIRNFYDTKYWA
jgi:aryl-alcohol dehydrogenase-like predicted oxidoreductase